MKLVINCFTNNYASFSGRAGRKEYWLFFLTMIIINIIASIVEFSTNLYYILDQIHIGILTTLIYLFLLVPGTAVTVRRLHDTNKSWRWIILVYGPLIGLVLVLIIFEFRADMLGIVGFGEEVKNFYGKIMLALTIISIAALVGSIWLLVLMTFKGTEGENRFGPDPLASSTTDSGGTA
ncbi:MAG: hypothetical protein CMM47_10875 [Rhodospirillaceae bacterium]|nr:hypothetical protein [Rhodospirillaceae bacterium]|tara:strand:+ start:478 stop:1014 length:537 start_codon:yes stop_codon:yes gene_type:complete